MQFGVLGQNICPYQSFIMRVSIFMVGLLTLTASLSAKSGYAQRLEDVRITLQLNHASMKEALREIESRTPFKFLARAEDVEPLQDITLAIKDQPVVDVLTTLFKGRHLQYKQVGVNIILKKAPSGNEGTVIPVQFKSPAAKFAVSGTVRSAGTGETILGATIRIGEPSAGTGDPRGECGDWRYHK